MVILNIIQCLIELLTFLIDGKQVPGYRTLLIVSSVILYINNIIFAFSWTIYMDYKLFRDMKRIKRIYPYVAIPAVPVIIGCLINLVTPMFFAVDEYTLLERGHGYYRCRQETGNIV